MRWTPDGEFARLSAFFLLMDRLEQLQGSMSRRWQRHGQGSVVRLAAMSRNVSLRVRRGPGLFTGGRKLEGVGACLFGCACAL